MNIIKTQISKILKEIIKDHYNFDIEEIKLDTPPKKELGDFCFWPFLLAKPLGKNPGQISNELLELLKNNSHFLELSVAGPYLNFKLSYEFYTELFLNEINTIPNIWNGGNVVVDYIGMNVWKPMHIWHMCTPNQWQITVNLYRLLWYNVIADSHLWDWGIIFGKLILAYKKWGNKEKLQENAVQHLFELYVKITDEIEKDDSLEEQTRQEFKKLSEWDVESIALWSAFTSESIKSMQVQLDRLWVKADYNIWESFYEGIWLPKMENYPDLQYKMSDVVKELLEKNIATQNDDNSVWVIFDEQTKLPSCILAKKDGTHWYLASDLAAIAYRAINWNPEKIIYHVDVRQDLHFKQAFEIVSNAQWIAKDKLFFAGNGFISLVSGAMSTRKGNIIKLEDLLDEAKERAQKILLEKNPEISKEDLEILWEIIWIGAIKYGYLSKARTTDVIFDWDEFMTFEWNSFPYVAYSYVRAKKLIEKSEISKEDLETKNIWSIFSSPEQIALYKEIVALNEVLLSVKDNCSYHNLVWYSYNLAKNFSALYNNVQILSEEDRNKKLLNLKLIGEYIKTQKIIFDILSIKLPEKM